MFILSNMYRLMSLQTSPCIFVPLQYYVLIYVSADLTSHLCTSAVLCSDLCLCRPYLTFMFPCSTMYRFMSLQTLSHLCSAVVLCTDLCLCSSVVPIVASYRKLVAVAENRRQLNENFHYRLLERHFRLRNASQRINLGDPISDENTPCFRILSIDLRDKSTQNS